MSNRTCVVIAHGPSLNDVPRSFLSAYPTFGVNKIFLLDGFRPTYYVSVHTEIVPFADQVMALGSQMFIKDRIAEYFPGCTPLHSVKRAEFYRRPSPEPLQLWEGWSIIYVCLQIAYWLDYTTALIVGLDHDYTNGSFHPNYTDGLPEHFKTTPHDQDKLLPAFQLAKENYERDRRRIINLTPGTKEPIFEKGRLEEWYPLSS